MYLHRNPAASTNAIYACFTNTFVEQAAKLELSNTLLVLSDDLLIYVKTGMPICYILLYTCVSGTVHPAEAADVYEHQNTHGGIRTYTAYVAQQKLLTTATPHL